MQMLNVSSKVVIAWAVPLVCGCGSADRPAPQGLPTEARSFCSTHHVPLTTVGGYAMPAPWPILDPEPRFERALKSFPEAISLCESLERTPEHTMPARIAYCPKCEDGLRQWFSARPR